jgi:hypothetical protein
VSEGGVGALCSPAVLFFAGVLAAMSAFTLLIALYGERKVLAWTAAASSAASSLVVAVCVWGVLDG